MRGRYVDVVVVDVVVVDVVVVVVVDVVVVDVVVDVVGAPIDPIPARIPSADG